MKLWYVYLENIFLEEKWMRSLGNSGGLQHSDVCVCLVLPGQLKGPEDAVRLPAFGLWWAGSGWRVLFMLVFPLLEPC